MFTVAAFALMAFIAWQTERANQKDPPSDDSRRTQDMIRYSRQDLRMIAWLLCAILVALGVIADKIH